MTAALVAPLGQLAQELRIGSLPWAEPVTLPSVTPTWREVEQAIDAQTPLRLRTRTCGTGATLLFGGYPFSRCLEPAR